jgi:ribonuclease HII
MIIGIDEVGRGCWAGPLLVVAARASKDLPNGLADSKLLTKKRREQLHGLIIQSCDLGEGWVQPDEIDEIGLAQAMRLGVERALTALEASSDGAIIMDGIVNYCPGEFVNVEMIAKADSQHPIVSAASIYAKVKRDQHMAWLAKVYPDYQFEKHVGYGTKLHQAMLESYGPSKIHRMSYKPLKQLLELRNEL